MIRRPPTSPLLPYTTLFRSLNISGVPAGVTLSTGTLNGDGSYTLTPGQLAGLTLTSDGETQHFDLTVKATTTDAGDTSIEPTPALQPHVDVARRPHLATFIAVAATSIYDTINALHFHSTSSKAHHD